MGYRQEVRHGALTATPEGSNPSTPVSNGSLCPAKQRSRKINELIPRNPYLRLQGSNPCRWILQGNVSFLSKHSFQLPLCSHGFQLSPSSVVGANPTVAIRRFAMYRGGRNIRGHSTKIRQTPTAQSLQTHNGRKINQRHLVIFCTNVHVAVR